MSKLEIFTSTDDLLNRWETLKTQDVPVIIYLTGGISAETGKNWCPDCEIASPMIEEHVISKSSINILKGVVEERNSWVGV